MVVVCASVCEVEDGLLVCSNGVSLIEECKYGSDVRVFEVYGSG